MLSFYTTLLRFFAAVGRGLRDPEFRAMFVTLVMTIFSGTMFFTKVEHWSWVDALYFCVRTLATAGSGDIAPTTPISKIFTIIYMLVGAGVFISLAVKLTRPRRHGSPGEVEREGPG